VKPNFDEQLPFKKHEIFYVSIGYTIKQKISINVLHWGMRLSLGNTLLIKKLNKETPKCK
jgi:hypothetical protein